MAPRKASIVSSWAARFPAFRSQTLESALARDPAIATVRRGDRSMGVFAGMYASSMALNFVLVPSAEVVADYVVSFLLLNSLILSYLFYWSSWWRNCIVLKLYNKMRID